MSDQTVASTYFRVKRQKLQEVKLQMMGNGKTNEVEGGWFPCGPSSAALKPLVDSVWLSTMYCIWSFTTESLCRQLKMVPKSCWIFLQSKLLSQGQATEEQPKRKSIFLCLFCINSLFLLPSLHSSTVKSFKSVLLFTGMCNVDCFFGVVFSQY